MALNIHKSCCDMSICKGNVDKSYSHSDTSHKLFIMYPVGITQGISCLVVVTSADTSLVSFLQNFLIYGWEDILNFIENVLIVFIFDMYIEIDMGEMVAWQQDIFILLIIKVPPIWPRVLQMACFLCIFVSKHTSNTNMPTTPLSYLDTPGNVFSSAVPPGSGAFQMPTCPSSAASASTLRGGKGQSQKRFSNFFSFFCMKLLWDDINNIS